MALQVFALFSGQTICRYMSCARFLGSFSVFLGTGACPVEPVAVAQIIDKAAAWAEVQTLPAFDNGNTLTNTLYWVATRP